MNKFDKTFDEKLIEMEKTNQGYRDKYEKEKKSMLEKKLNNFWRTVFAILSILGLLAAIFYFWALSTANGRSALVSFGRKITILGGILSLIWMVAMGWIAIKGKLNLRKEPARIAAFSIFGGFFLVSYSMLLFVFPIAFIEPTDYRSICGMYIAIIGFFFVVTIALALIISTLYRFGYKDSEKLLEIELQLAELSEKLEGKK